MDTVVLILDILVCIAIALGIYYMVRDMVHHKDQTMAELKVGGWSKTIKTIIISTVFLFLDMFGIGSYGPHMACWKIFKVTRDEWIPGTLNVCMLTATLVETLYLVNNVDVEMTTLIPCIIAATLGSWLGGGIVVKLNVNKIRLAVGLALAIVGIVLILQLTGIMPTGTEGEGSHGLQGISLVIIVAISLLFGALMTIGIGIYAPLLACASLLGMDPLYATPIMVGTCAFICPAAAIRFAKASYDSDKPKYDRKIAVVVTLTGWIGPVIASNVLLALPTTALKWIVVCVMFIVSAMMLYQWYNKSADAVAEKEDAELASIESEPQQSQ